MEIKQKYLVPGAILIGAVIIAGTIVQGTYSVNKNIQEFKGNTPSEANQQGRPGQPVSADIKNVNLNGEPFYGSANAPVTIAYWSDYQCPFCKKFETETMPSIISSYVNSGKVRIVFKDFQFLGPDSEAAGLFARGVWDLYPGQFFAWREAMFNKQDKENSGFGNEASIEALTQGVPGIDVSKVVAAISSKKDQYQKAMDADKNEAEKFGLQGTPGFIVGKQLIPGAVPFANFKQIIDAELK